MGVSGGVQGDNLLSVEVEETLFCWGYGIEAKTKIEKDDQEKVPDSIEIEGGRCLNVAMRRRLARCHWCHLRKHLKKNCPDSSTKKRIWKKKAQVSKWKTR